MAVTAVALMYQCAETARIARGRGTEVPNERQASVYRLRSRAFIGVPCPKKAAGMVVIAGSPASDLQTHVGHGRVHRE
jgi:hypothetical protein